MRIKEEELETSSESMHKFVLFFRQCIVMMVRSEDAARNELQRLKMVIWKKTKYTKVFASSTDESQSAENYT